MQVWKSLLKENFQMCLGLPDCCIQNTRDFFKPCEFLTDACSCACHSAYIQQQRSRAVARKQSRCFAIKVWPYLNEVRPRLKLQPTISKQERIIALQDHPGSLILTEIKSSHTTTYWLATITLVISYRISETVQVKVSDKTALHTYPYEFWGVPVVLD